MRRKFFLLPLIFFLATGCVSVKNYGARPANLFPANGFQVHRAIFTALGKQFTFNGYLALSETGGQRLVITENFGNVLADVLIKPDGKIFVMQSSKIFTPERIRRFVAADLETICGAQSAAHWPAKMLSENHFLLKRHFYSLDLHIVETKIGAQPSNLFDESKAQTPEKLK